MVLEEKFAELVQHFNLINFKELITLADLAEDLFADHLIILLAGFDFIIKFAAATTNWAAEDYVIIVSFNFIENLFYQLDCLPVILVNFFRRVIKFNFDSIAIAVAQVFIEIVE